MPTIHSPRHPNWSCPRIAVLATLLIGCCLASWGQIPIVRGTTPPKNVKGAHWYHDTAHKKVWSDLSLEWTELGIENVQEMFSVGNFVIVRSDLGYSILSQFAEYVWAATHLRVTDSLVMAWDTFATHIYLHNGSQFHPEHGFKRACWPIDGKAETVQGQPAYCLPDFSLANDTVVCDSLDRYGMFGLTGRWLIAPQFERPFHFVDGVAEVWVGGQRRRINERGEWVE